MSIQASKLKNNLPGGNIYSSRTSRRVLRYSLGIGIRICLPHCKSVIWVHSPSAVADTVLCTVVTFHQIHTLCLRWVWHTFFKKCTADQLSSIQMDPLCSLNYLNQWNVSGSNNGVNYYFPKTVNESTAVNSTWNPYHVCWDGLWGSWRIPPYTETSLCSLGVKTAAVILPLIIL